MGAAATAKAAPPRKSAKSPTRAKGAPAAVTARKRRTTPADVAPTRPADPIEIRKAASRGLALQLAHVGLEKKAERIEIVDVSEKVDYADYLVLMTGRSDRQVVAIAQAIEDTVEQQGQRRVGLEGLPQGHWVLIDGGDVVVHVFLDEARKYYDLEGLWLDAPRVDSPGVTGAAVRTSERAGD